MSIEVRLLKDDEHDKVVDFFNNTREIDAQHIDYRTIERFRWEFLNGPSGKAIYIIAVNNEDAQNPKIVGTQCAIPLMMISSSGEKVLTAKLEDTLLDIDSLSTIYSLQKSERRDILKKMFDLLYEEFGKIGISAMWGFTYASATFKRLGFSIPFTTNNAILVIKPVKAYNYLSKLNPNNRIADKFKICILSFVSSILGLKRVFSHSGVKYVHTNRQIENMELFYRSLPDNKNYYFLEQSNDYVNWRLTTNQSDIVFFTKQFFTEEKQFVGEIIYSFSKGVAYIEQMLFDKQLSRSVKLGFIRTIISELVSKKAYIIRFTGFKNNEVSNSEIELLTQLGFIFTKKGISFVYKQLHSSMDIKPEELILSRLYFQGVRQ